MSNQDTINLYNLLGVGHNASEIEIKKAYKKQALVNHPDKGGSEDLFKQISYAYHVLIDKDKKTVYDQNYEGDDMTIDVSGLINDTSIRLSDTYKELIIKWIEEYSDNSIVNNFNVIFPKILTKILENTTINKPKTNTCDICGHTYQDTHKHHKHASSRYIEYINQIKTEDLDTLLKDYVGDKNYVYKKLKQYTQTLIPISILSGQWLELNAHLEKVNKYN